MKSDYLRMLLEAKDKSAILDNMAQTSFDELIELDLKKNTVRSVYHTQNKYLTPPRMKSPLDAQTYAADHLIHPDDRAVFLENFDIATLKNRLEQAAEAGALVYEARVRLAGGGWRWTEQVLLCGGQYGLPEGVVQLYVYDNQDGRDRADAAGRTQPEPRDELTGLYWEKAFFDQAQRRLASLTGAWCVVAIEIEHFKLFCDWNGQQKGVELLRRWGAILRDYARGTDSLAGYRGQDDFCLLTPYDRPRIDALYEELCGCIRALSGCVGFLPIFGICLIDGADDSILDTFNHAALTAEDVKGDYRNRIQLYSAAAHEKRVQGFRMLSDFQHALEAGEIHFFLQPQCRVANRRIVGAESLARWRKADGDWISPAVFVPILEKYGIVTNLDRFIWESVCRWLRSMLDRGTEPVPVSVNVSQIDFFTIDVPCHLLDLMKRYDLPVRYLKVEVTESAYVEDSSTVRMAVSRLREMGFTVLMDDFGSGYSSLNMLRSVEVDIIKLDARFLHLEDREERKGVSILESIVNMGKNLGTPMIVEGIETPEQVNFLSDLGCSYMQGFYFYRPMPPEEFERLIADGDRADRRGFVFKANQQLHIREFLDANVFSDAMLNNVLGPVCFYSWKDDNVDILRFNQQFYRMVGLNADVLSQRREHIQEYLHPDDREGFFRMLAAAERDHINGAMGTFRVYKPNGTIVWIGLHVYFMGEDQHGKRFYASAHDKTELQYINEELPGSYFRCTTDNGFEFRYVSQNFQEMTGYSVEEIRSRFDNRMIDMVHPEDRARLTADAAALAAGEIRDLRPYRIRHKNGHVIYVLEKARLTDQYGPQCWQCVCMEVTELVRLRNQMRLLTGYLSSSIVFVHLYQDQTLRYEVAVHGLEKQLGMDLPAFQTALNDGSFLNMLDTVPEHRDRQRYWQFRENPAAMNETVNLTLPGRAPVRLRCRFDRVAEPIGSVVCIIDFSIDG